ncbi:MAG: hypothetical protein LBR47_04055 [Spirochaetaceae bacterium]|nr:hypothetical protein [Spirochaetaceae bacterium]
MGKKLIVLAAALFCIGTVNLFAWGIGAQLGGAISDHSGGNAAITFKLDDIPWVFAVDGSFGPNRFNIGVTADMWVINPNIVGPLNFYVGWGLFGGIGIYDSDVSFVAGGRVPIGLNAFFFNDFFEPYLQIAPGIGVHAGSDGVGLYWYIPINLGFRFWFK